MEEKMKTVVVVARTKSKNLIRLLSTGALLVLLFGCESEEKRYARWRLRRWEEPCHDVSILVATTAGSPSDFECPNRRHRMRVQITTTKTNEEVAALVFCECVSSDSNDAGPGESP
jgi:hypothetical protein